MQSNSGSGASYPTLASSGSSPFTSIHNAMKDCFVVRNRYGGHKVRQGKVAVMVRLGYKASAEQFGPRELVELGVLAEAHGMDSATVSDHFQPWRHEGGHAPFSLAWMTAVGERTERLQLGTSVMTPTFRYNPAVIAQAFATMGCLYPDRIFLGVGTGEALNEIATGYEGEWPEF